MLLTSPDRDAEYIRSKMKVQPGCIADAKAISDDISAIYGKGAYDYVNFELRGTGEPYKLWIQCKRGPMHQFGMGARIDTEEVVSLLLNVGLNTNAMRGSSLDITSRISLSPYLDLLYSYNAPRFSTFNVRALIKYTDRTAFQYASTAQTQSLFQAVQEVFFSNMHWSSLDVKLGIRNQYMQLMRNTSTESTGRSQNDFFHNSPNLL